MVTSIQSLLGGKKHLPLVVFVELSRLTVFSAMNDDPLILEYPEDVVEDMEFTDTRFIETQLISWKNEEKIVESNTFIIFAESCYFRQDFPKQLAIEDPQVKTFLSMVPFEHKLSKTFQTQQGGTAVSMSTNLYRPIVQVLDSHHYRVTLALPQFAINIELLKQAKPNEVVTKLGRMFDQLKLFSFVSEEERERKIQSDKKIQTGLPQDKKQLIMLSAVFGVLLVALVLVYRWSITPDPIPPQPELPVITSPLATPLPEAVEKVSESADQIAPDSATLASFSVRVLNGSGIPGQADQVRQALEDVGFTEVSTGNNSGGTVSRASIIFSSSVPESVRQLVMQAVSAVVTAEPIVQDSTETSSTDVTVITSP